MTLLRTSPTLALQFALGFQDRDRKHPVVPWTNSTTMDDCAAFQSFVLWGPTASGVGPITWVDNFKKAIDGTYHAGKAGMQPGDVILFDWEGNGVGNHVEMCLTSPNSRGAFTTVGANGSDTIQVKVRQRNAYVMGYFRANWGASPTTPAEPKEDDMGKPIKIRNSETGEIRLVDVTTGFDQPVPNPDYDALNDALALTGDSKNLTPNVFGYYRDLARTAREAQASTLLNTVVDTGWNGKQSVSNMIVGADKKAGTATASVTIDPTAIQAAIKSLTFGAK